MAKEELNILKEFYDVEHTLSFDDVVVGPVADDTVGLLIRQFSRGTIDAEYLKKVGVLQHD